MRSVGFVGRRYRRGVALLESLLDLVTLGPAVVGGACLVWLFAWWLGSEDIDFEYVYGWVFGRPAVFSCRKLLDLERPPTRTVAVLGRLVGPDGPLTAPLSGRACAWYRVQIFSYYHDSRTEVGPVDPAWERTSSQFVRLTDGTTSIAVAQELLGTHAVDHPEAPLITSWSDVDHEPEEQPGLDRLRALGLIGPNAFRKRGYRTSIWVEEQIAPLDLRVVAVGRTLPGFGVMTLVKPPIALVRSGVTRNTPGYLRRRPRTDPNKWAKLKGLLTVGLISGGGGAAAYWLLHQFLLGW